MSVQILFCKYSRYVYLRETEYKRLYNMNLIYLFSEKPFFMDTNISVMRDILLKLITQC